MKRFEEIRLESRLDFEFLWEIFNEFGERFIENPNRANAIHIIDGFNNRYWFIPNPEFGEYLTKLLVRFLENHGKTWAYYKIWIQVYDLSDTHGVYTVVKSNKICGISDYLMDFDDSDFPYQLYELYKKELEEIENTLENMGYDTYQIGIATRRMIRDGPDWERYK